MRFLVMALGWSVASSAWAQSVGIDGGPCSYPSVVAALGSATDGSILYVQEGYVSLEGGYSIELDVTITTGDAFCSPDPSADPATLDGNSVLGPIGVGQSKVVTMENLVLTDHRGADGGNLYVEGDLQLIDVVVQLGGATRGGGAFVEKGGELTVSGATEIRDNGCGFPGSGGGIFVNEGGYANLEDDATVFLNVATEGGGIYAMGGVSMFDNAVIMGNEAVDGAGIYLFDNLVNSFLALDADCAACFVTANIASGDGGGIYADLTMADDTVALDEVWVTKNSAGGDGGGIYAVGSGDLVLDDTEVVENLTFAGAGGGLYLDGEWTAQVLGSTFRENGAVGDGGGVYLVGPLDYTSVGTLYHGNGALGEGGALMVAADGTSVPSVDLDGPKNGAGVCLQSGTVPAADAYCSEIRDNWAYHGGGMAIYAGAIDIDRTAFLSNDAFTDGHAIWLEDDDSPSLLIINALVADHAGAANQTVVRAGAGTTLDARQLTVAGNLGTAVRYSSGASGQFLRGIIWDGAFFVGTATTIAADCTSYSTRTGTGTLTGGSIDAGQNPLFTVHPTRGDYHLEPGVSPGVDRCPSGHVTDLDSVARFLGARFDRGTFEAAP